MKKITITKEELFIMACVLRDGKASIFYRDTANVQAARSLVEKGLLSCNNYASDWENFKATRKGTRRMLHGVTDG